MTTQVVNQLQHFFTTFPQKTYQARELIVRAGRPPAGIFYLESGLVGLTATSAAGQPLLLTIFKPHSFFPLMWGLNQTPNRYDFEVLQGPVVARVAPARQVQQFLQTHPEALLDLSQRLLSGLQGVLLELELQMGGSARQKLIVALLTAAWRFGRAHDSGWTQIELPMTVTLLAKQAGLSRETASRELQLLEEEKVIERRGRTPWQVKLSALAQGIMV